jgi:uncharacterized protein (UPF0276 family)
MKTSTNFLNAPATAGVSLKHTYYHEVVQSNPPIDFFEVHSENYMTEGGCSLAWLETIRELYPISLHGVSLSLGSAQDLDKRYLQSLKILIERIDPCFVSDHLSWSMIEGVYMNDLLPLPYTKESLQQISDHISEAQDFLGRTLFIENPSSYMYFPKNEFTEPEFLADMVKRTGCKLLLDVNNIYVSAHNNNFDAASYIDSLPQGIIGEMHLAGHNRKGRYYIDDHGCSVHDEVWELYKRAISRFGSVPTMIEWDSHIPPLSILLNEAQKAKGIMQEYGQYAATA